MTGNDDEQEDQNLVGDVYDDEDSPMFGGGGVDSESQSLGGPDEQPPADKSTGTVDNSGDDTNSKSETSSQPVSIRTIWDNHSFYLSDCISDNLGSRFKKLDWELSDEYGIDIKKTRNYYPLIASLGLEKLETLDNDEIKERIEEIEPEDDYF
jgi:hypothetical protein